MRHGTTNRLIRLAAAVLIVAATLPVVAEVLRCATCGRRVSGRYLTASGKAYCSEVCFEKTLPQCPVCGRRVKGKHPVSEGVHYCSDACYERTLPRCEICGLPVRRGATVDGHVYCAEHADLPRCSNCGLPSAHTIPLEDERRLCRVCMKAAVFDLKVGERLYREAEDLVFNATRLRSPTRPVLRLAWLTEIRERLSYETDSRMVQRGLYSRTVTTTRKTNIFGRVVEEVREIDETVYLLHGMAPRTMLITAAHELTHDLIAEEFPEVREDAPLWVEEGICQYVAAMVCRQRGFTDILEEIESCPDPVYGDGYRYIKRRAGAYNWSALVHWVRTNDLSRLPRSAPVVR